MVRTAAWCWLLGLGVALTSPIASADDSPDAEIAALGGRCFHNATAETIGVDLSNTWVTDADLAKLARLSRLERHQPGLYENHGPGPGAPGPAQERQVAQPVLRGIRHG